MGDTVIIDEPKPEKPDMVVVVPEAAARTEKKTVTEKTVTVTESTDD